MWLDFNSIRVLNVYAFEKHTGCKTKHPNNHIYFQRRFIRKFWNLGTLQKLCCLMWSKLYQPESFSHMERSNLFHLHVFCIFFRLSKSSIFNCLRSESFQPAVQELQRMYAKEDCFF